MRKALFPLALVAALCVVFAACSDGGSSSTPKASSYENIGAGLTGPAGASATVVAAGLKNVSGLAEDSQGRLWAVTAAFNDIGTDALYVIPAPGQDAVKVAGDLHTPMGLLWTSDRLYVSSAEGVIAFDGFDGARFAKQQTIATFSGAGIMGGLALGNDGRIRVGISAACDNCVPDSKWAASVVSFLPDGSDAKVEASGIRAPVGLTYVPGTNDLLVTMNQRDDLGDATPGDYLALVLSGQTWGFPSCYGQGGSDCAGVPPPIAEMDKHAAVSGIAVLTVAGKTSAFAAEWATGKLVRVELISSNGSYSGTIEQPITGIQGPVGVTASGGSSLLVGDWVTGTVYKITLPAT